MKDFSDIIDLPPYSLKREEKEFLFNNNLIELSKFHYNRCSKYAKIIDGIKLNLNDIDNYYEIPFLPVRLFKMFDLKSVNDEEIIKTMTSSGTSGQTVSKIFLELICMITYEMFNLPRYIVINLYKEEK